MRLFLHLSREHRRKILAQFGTLTYLLVRPGGLKEASVKFPEHCNNFGLRGVLLREYGCGLSPLFPLQFSARFFSLQCDQLQSVLYRDRMSSSSIRPCNSEHIRGETLTCDRGITLIVVGR